MLNHKVASTPLRSSFAENIRCATYPPPPGSAPGYQLAHQFTARYVNKVIAGIHTESSSGKNESREPTCALEASSAVILDFRASIPPTACTARIASTITMPILSTNWNRSVTSTPHNPDMVV